MVRKRELFGLAKSEPEAKSLPIEQRKELHGKKKRAFWAGKGRT